VRERPRSSTLAVLILSVLTSCTALSTLTPPPPLFPDRSAVDELDFEQDALGQPPQGFKASAPGQWRVADSPTAASGNQVLAHGGATSSSLDLTGSATARSAAAQVSVRIFLGSAGAGIACDGSADSYVLKVEPHAARVALYRGTGGSLTLVDQVPMTAVKGDWVRIGLRCDGVQVVGYVNGKPALRSKTGVAPFQLALVSDAGVTAQFDDLKYWAEK
jgi:hypothetical protein